MTSLAAGEHEALEVSFEQVTKTFVDRHGKGTEAISDVSGTISPGSFVSVVGPSGCGKSTLLSMLAGLETASSGRVLVGGQEVRSPRGDVGMVFQEDSTLPWRSALRNVTFGLEQRRVPARQRTERAMQMLELVGLRGFEHFKPRSLSGGMRQRVAIARTLALSPRVLLMDEPFGALDRQTRLIIGSELLRIWRESSATAVFVTHDIEEAVLLSTEVWVMSCRPGEIIAKIPVDLPYPRGLDTVTEPEFIAITSRVWNELKEQSERAFAQSLAREQTAEGRRAG